MLVTRDFVVQRVRGDKNSGTLDVSVEIDDGIASYLGKASEIGISTRSKLARCFCVLYPTGDLPRIRDGRLCAEVMYVNHRIPVNYAVGDNVGRFYALREEERITGSRLADIAGKSMAQVTDPDTDLRYAFGESMLVDVGDEYLHPKSSPVPMTAQEVMEGWKRLISISDRREWQQMGDHTLLLTRRVSLPEGVFGLVEGTTWLGQTYHVPSKVVDPGWDKRLVIELDTSGDPAYDGKPKAVIALYDETVA